MARKKPTQRLDIIGKLNISPIKAHEEYLCSKQQNKLYIKPCNADNAGDSIESIYIRNQLDNARIMKCQREILKAQQKMAYSHAKRIRTCEHRFIRLRKRLKDGDVFLKDCQDKKLNAAKKIAAEEETHAKLFERIKKLSIDNKKLAEFRATLQATVDEYEPYERVLQDIVDQSDTFESIEDLIQRCDALMLTQVEAININSSKLEDIEAMRNRMVQLIRDASQKVLGLKNELDKHLRLSNQVKASAMQWENTLERIKDEIGEKQKMRRVTYDGINQIYQMLCKRQKISSKNRHRTLENQLNYIRDQIFILQDVLSQCQKIVPDKSKEESGSIIC